MRVFYWACPLDSSLKRHSEYIWHDWLPMCVSGEVKREVLDKCKVLSADTGHHNDTVLPWNVCCFLLQCTQQNLRPALYQTSAQMYLTHTHTLKNT